ncbi:MAG TPA: hypothetical protein VIL86_14835 [Tepidisphaeraceae bacterium]|jgi:PBP1b-binding outer membrane lipoprotein LpoB
MSNVRVVLVVIGALFVAGCIYPAPRTEVREVVVDEPPPVERVYIVDRGYPPGCYEYGGTIWYEGRRYRREVFVTKVVNVNIQRSRYTNVTENRNVVNNVKVQHQQQYEAARRSQPAPAENRKKKKEKDDQR